MQGKPREMFELFKGIYDLQVTRPLKYLYLIMVLAGRCLALNQLSGEGCLGNACYDAHLTPQDMQI